MNKWINKLIIISNECAAIAFLPMTTHQWSCSNPNQMNLKKMKFHPAQISYATQ